MNKEMSADDLCRIFCKTRPELFNHIYKECKFIFTDEQEGILHEFDENERKYWINEELNIARALVYDYERQANKIGKILVSATE